MELTVWVDGIQKVVSGVTSSTTGQEVVLALAQASGRSGCFSLVQSWGDWERPLPPSESPVQSLVRWGEYAGQVRFSLVQKATLEGGRRQNDPFRRTLQKEAVRPSLTPVRSQNEIGKVSKPNSLRKSLTFSGAHKSVPISAMENVERHLTPSLFPNRATQSCSKELSLTTKKISPVPKVNDSVLLNSKPKSPVIINKDVPVGNLIERTHLVPQASKIPLTKRSVIGNTRRSDTSLVSPGEHYQNEHLKNCQQLLSIDTLTTEGKPLPEASTQPPITYMEKHLPTTRIQRYLQTPTAHNQGQQQTSKASIQQQEHTLNTVIHQKQHTPTTNIQLQQQAPTTHTQRNLQTQIPKSPQKTGIIDSQRKKDKQLTPSDQLPHTSRKAIDHQTPPKTQSTYDQPQSQEHNTYDHSPSQIKKIHSQSLSRTYKLEPQNGTQPTYNLPDNPPSTKDSTQTRHQITTKQTSGLQCSRIPMMSNMAQAKSTGKYEQITITTPVTNWQNLSGSNMTSFKADNLGNNQSQHFSKVSEPSSHQSVVPSKYATLNRSIKQTTIVNSVGHCRSISADNNNNIGTRPRTSYLDELYKKAYPTTHQLHEKSESPLCCKTQGSYNPMVASTASSVEPKQIAVSAGSGLSTLKATKARLISSLLPTLVKESARQEHDARLVTQTGTKFVDGCKEQSINSPTVIHFEPSDKNGEQSTDSPTIVHLRNNRPGVATMSPSTQRHSAMMHVPNKLSVPPRPRSVIYNVNSLGNSDIITSSKFEHFLSGSVVECTRSFKGEMESPKEDSNTHLPIMPKVDYLNEFRKHTYHETNSDLRDQRSDTTHTNFQHDQNMSQIARNARTDHEILRNKSGDYFANNHAVNQQDDGSLMEHYLPGKKISLQDRDRQLANYLKQEQTINNDIAILESTDWMNVIQDECNKGRELQLLIANLKEELEYTEARIKELRTEESIKSMEMAAENDRIVSENHKNQELEEKVSADVRHIREELIRLSESHAEQEEKLKHADQDLETLEAAWTHKVKIIQIMEDALNMDPNFSTILASLPDSATHSGEVVLKILERRSSPEHLRTSPEKVLSQKSQTTTTTAMVVIEPNGVWV